MTENLTKSKQDRQIEKLFSKNAEANRRIEILMASRRVDRAMLSLHLDQHELIMACVGDLLRQLQDCVEKLEKSARRNFSKDAAVEQPEPGNGET